MNNDLFYKGSFGLERETLRVDSSGRLAQTPHPFADSENITRDFCENQIELITPVCKSVGEMMTELEKLDRRVSEELAKNGERLWLYSNPPYFESENEIPVADFTGEHSGKRRYRDLLERRYGKRLMLFSGIHFNFSFDEEYLKTLYSGDNFEGWRNGFYLRLYKQLSVHSWLPLLLTAASPIYDRSLDTEGGQGCIVSRYGSMRSSERGYWNEFLPVLRYDSLEDHIGSIREYVDKGLLFSASELYLPVRLKPRGVNSIESFKNGISHIELRMFDLEPSKPLGIDENDLEFAHYLIMYLSAKEDFEYTPEMQEQAVRDHKNAALLDLEGVSIGGVPIRKRAEQILDDIAEFLDDAHVREIIAYEKQKLNNRPCERILNQKICG